MLRRPGAGRPPAVGVAAGDVEHPWPAGPDPDRRRPTLIRLGVQSGVVQGVELPVEVDRPVAFPEQPDYPQRLLESGDGPDGSRSHRAGCSRSRRCRGRGRTGRGPGGRWSARSGPASRDGDGRCRQRRRPAARCGQGRCRGCHRQSVEVAMRRRRNGGQIGEFRSPDRVRPEADHVVGQPDRVVPTAVQIVEPRQIQRQGGAQECGGLNLHRDMMLSTCTAPCR